MTKFLFIISEYCKSQFCEYLNLFLQKINYNLFSENIIEIYYSIINYLGNDEKFLLEI